MIQYEDGKKRLNDLQRIPYMIRRLPEWRRDATTYDDIDKSAVEPINPKKVAGEKQSCGNVAGEAKSCGEVAGT